MTHAQRMISGKPACHTRSGKNRGVRYSGKMRTNDVKLGPNDLCHCGSGLKYKKCHLGQDQSGGVQAEPPKAEQRRDPLILNEIERNGMRKASTFNAELLDQVRAFVKP